MAIDFLNDTGLVENRSPGQTHHNVWRDVLKKKERDPSSSPSGAAVSGLGDPGRFGNVQSSVSI